MKNLKAVLFCLSVYNSYSLKLEDAHEQFQPQFCWKDSYGRGVGTIPNTCSAGRVQRGALCYDPCPPNSKQVALDCHVNCPNESGWRDDGLFCRRVQYGRGAGYPWKGSDGISDKGMRKRCQKDHGAGNCQKKGAIFYPKCKQGYSSFGCCICRPDNVDCGKYGLGAKFDISCSKVKSRDPHELSCPDDKQKDAGLCYKKCKPGYDGIGPVCWAKKPDGWSNCGMGAAKSGSVCAKIIFDQVATVGQLALNIATLGTSQSVTSKARFATLQKKLKQNQKLVQDLHKANKPNAVNQAAINLNDILNADPDKLNPEDIVRMTAQLAALMDPTGVAGVIAAYTYPKCSKLKS